MQQNGFIPHLTLKKLRFVVFSMQLILFNLSDATQLLNLCLLEHRFDLKTSLNIFLFTTKKLSI